MLNENAQLWITDLRSGKFKQGQGHLTQIDAEGNEYDCCLGVACKTYQRVVGDLTMEKTAAANDITVVRYDGERGTPPMKVQLWLGLTAPDGGYRKSALAHDNDSLNKTFEQIADIIASEPPGMFIDPETLRMFIDPETLKERRVHS